LLFLKPSIYSWFLGRYCSL